MRFLYLVMLLSVSFAYADTQANRQPLSITHWWISDAAQESMDIILDAADARGIQLEQTPIASHRDLRELVSDMLRVGYPPDFTQWLASGDLETLMLKDDTVLTWPDLSHQIVPELRDILAIGGEMGAIPVVTHIQNSMFVNTALLKTHGLDMPTDWHSLRALLRQLDGLGVQGVITSNEPWQIRMLFDDILLGLGGPKVYSAFYEMARDKETQRVLTEVFDILLEIRSYQPPNQPVYWGEITQKFGRGDIGFFFLGDFAWAMLIRTPGINIDDFACITAPGTQNVLMYATDIFIGFKHADPDSLADQMAFGKLLLDPQVQKDFVARKGGMPVILGLESDTLAPCAQFAHAQWNKKTTEILPTPWSFNRTALSQVETVIAEIWDDPDITAEAAAERLMNRIRMAAEIQTKGEN